jgi:signal recognition particle receptor subunit alpha
LLFCSQDQGKPYVIVFCGVNGVGKSTNLAKIAYWLGQHNIKVTIAACDTFRAGEETERGCSAHFQFRYPYCKSCGKGTTLFGAEHFSYLPGAVEQLKTHCARLGVPLYERGYEKDPAKVAAEAIKQAERDGRHVVLVDTAGRMQVCEHVGSSF